jgi:hypothetical protein
VIVIMSGEFDAERLTSVYSAEGNVEGHRPNFDSEVQSVVTRWLATQETDCYQQGLEELVLRYDKCLSYGGDYVKYQH